MFFKKLKKIPNNERSITHLFTITDIVATILIYINKNNNNDSIINDNNIIIEEKKSKIWINYANKTNYYKKL